MRKMMPRTVLHGAAAICLAAAVAAVAADPAAAATLCPVDERAVHVTLDVLSGKTIWRTSHGRSHLRRLASKIVSPRSRQDHPLGLTVTNFNQLMKTEVTVASLGGKRFCAVPSKIEFTTGYPEFFVYIDRRYRAGTCQYRQIRIHELRHVEIYRRQLGHFAPLIRGRLKEAAARLKPVFLKNPGVAADRVGKRLAAKIKNLVDQLHRATDTDNGRIDSPASYARIKKRCRSW
jgi:hypothetical protein